MRPSCSATRSGSPDGIPGAVVLQDHRERLGPLRPRRGGAGALEELPELGGPQPERCPPVPELDGAAQGSSGAATDPERDVGLDRVGLDQHPAERIVVTGVARLALGQRGPQCAHRVVGHRPATGELGTEERELPFERPGTNTEDQPAAADDVECAVALRDRQRVVVAEHEHEGGESDRRSCGRRGSRTARADPSTCHRGPRRPGPGRPRARCTCRSRIPAARPRRRRRVISSMPASASHRACAPGRRVTTGVTIPSRNGVLTGSFWPPAPRTAATGGGYFQRRRLPAISCA